MTALYFKDVQAGTLGHLHLTLSCQSSGSSATETIKASLFLKSLVCAFHLEGAQQMSAEWINDWRMEISTHTCSNITFKVIPSDNILHGLIPSTMKRLNFLFPLALLTSLRKGLIPSEKQTNTVQVKFWNLHCSLESAYLFHWSEFYRNEIIRHQIQQLLSIISSKWLTLIYLVLQVFLDNLVNKLLM